MVRGLSRRHGTLRRLWVHAKSLRSTLRTCCAIALIPASSLLAQPTTAPGKPRFGVKLIQIEEPGAVIIEVMTGYAAESAGLQPGDRVVKIGNEEIEGVDDFKNAAKKLSDGQTTPFTVVRDGKQTVVNFRLTPPREDAPGAKPPTNPELRDQLLNMMKSDQEARKKLMEDNPADEEKKKLIEQMTKADEANREKLKQIIAKHGYPTISMVGDEAAMTAFLIVQHADCDPKWQEQMLPVLQQLADKGEVAKSSVAYLTDRVLRAHNKPQLYGTQIYDEAAPDGKMHVVPPVVEDPKNLDQRRLKMGMGPWAQYDQQLAEMQGREPFKTPRGPDDAASNPSPTTQRSTGTTP